MGSYKNKRFSDNIQELGNVSLESLNSSLEKDYFRSSLYSDDRVKVGKSHSFCTNIICINFTLFFSSYDIFMFVAFSQLIFLSFYWLIICQKHPNFGNILSNHPATLRKHDF